VWHLVLEDLSIVRRIDEEHGESYVTEAIAADLSAAGELCYIASDILDNRVLSELVSADAGRYWELLSDVISDLIELRGILIKAIPAGEEVKDRAKELSPVVKERVGELLRGIISELGVSVAKLEDELDECKEKLDACKPDQGR
jgi:Ni,Fe-hydrogenase maturation factor